jgi:hypothetical protein
MDHVSLEMAQAIADQVSLLARFDRLVLTEVPHVASVVLDALCHIQLGVDLMQHLQSPQT